MTTPAQASGAEKRPRQRRIRLITVCDACLRASCWHGEFFCEEYQSAGTVKKTAADLRKLGLEHAHHFSRENVEAVCGGSEWLSPAGGVLAPTPTDRSPT